MSDRIGVAARDSQIRQAQISGDGPRIQPLEVDALNEDLRAMLVRMIAINSAIDSREADTLTDLIPEDAQAPSEADQLAMLAKLPEIMRTMLHHPKLFSRQVDIGIQLLSDGALSGRDRELAILRIGWLCRAPYEWGEHVLIARKMGISSDDIERITHGSDAMGWSAHESAILRATEELHADAMISDATWAVLSQQLDARQLIELPILVGQYQAVAYYQNALRLRLHEGNLGLDAR